jgi:hypothetical protein
MKRIIIGTIVVLGVVGFFVVANQMFRVLTRVECGENLQSVDWLPDSATKISYAKCYNWDLYEFDIAENDFLIWADRFELSEITEPFYITRYNIDDSRVFDGPESFLGGKLEAVPEYTAMITNGLFYYDYKEHNHGGIYVAFDREDQRAYFHYAAR